MFGYVRPVRPELKCRDFDLYRATYCGLCRCLRRRFGLIAPMLLNFDFTFLALLLWQNAGRPEPAALPAFADTADAETAKAAQWCTEQGLLTTEDGAFHPEQKVTKYRVIRIWKQAAAPQQ